MNKLFSLCIFLTLSVNLFSQEIPIHLLRTEDTTQMGQLIAPHIDEFGEFTYHSIPVLFLNDSTMTIGGDTIIHSGNIANYASGGSNEWDDLIGIPDSIVFQSELEDSTDAIRADFPVPGVGSWNDLPDIPADFADGVDNVDDDDASSTNELQTLSFASGAIGLTGQAGSVTQAQLNYWIKSSNNLYYNTGNIGIGSSIAPESRLHLNSGGLNTSNGLTLTQGGSTYLTSSNVSNLFNSTYILHNVKFQNGWINYNNNHPSAAVVLNSATDKSVINFYTSKLNGGGFGNLVARFDEEGRLSLGGQVASHRLDVQGTARLRSMLNYGNSTKFAVLGETTNDVIGYRTFDPDAINSYFTYNNTTDALYNNTGTKLGINTTSPDYALHVVGTNFNSARFGNVTGSSLFINNNNTAASLRNFASGSGQGIDLNSVSNSIVFNSENKNLYWSEKGVLLFQDTDLTAATALSFTGSLGRDENSDRLAYHDGTGYKTLAFTDEITGGASDLAAVLAVGNAANNAITNLTAGTSDTDAANVEQTYYNISTTETIADYKLNNAIIYAKKLSLTSINNTQTLSFPTPISGLVRLVDLDVNFNYDGGKQKAGGCDFVFGATTYVSVSEDAGIITITNMSGFTLSNVDFYAYYTK